MWSGRRSAAHSARGAAPLRRATDKGLVSGWVSSGSPGAAAGRGVRAWSDATRRRATRRAPWRSGSTCAAPQRRRARPCEAAAVGRRQRRCEGETKEVPQTHCSLVEIFCCHQHCAHELCSMSAAKMAARCGVELRRWKERVTAPGARCWSAHVEPAQAPNGCELSENGRDDLCFNEIGDAGATQLATRCAPPPAWSSCTPAATSSAMRARRSSPTRCAPIPA